MREAIQPALTKHALSVVQLPWVVGGHEYIVTRMGHKSGQWIESWIQVDVGRGSSTMQARGSAITYARRYALMAMLNIAPDDDDGEASMQRSGVTPPPARPPVPAAPPADLGERKAVKLKKADQISDEQYKALLKLVASARPEMAEVDQDKFLLWTFNAKYYKDLQTLHWDRVAAKHAASALIAFGDASVLSSAIKKWENQNK